MTGLLQGFSTVARRMIQRFGVRSFLLLLLLLSVTASIAVELVRLVDEIAPLTAWIVGGAACLVGWRLVTLSLSDWSAAIWSIIIGLLLIVLTVGRLTDELWVMPSLFMKLNLSIIRLGWHLIWDWDALPRMLDGFLSSWQAAVTSAGVFWQGASVVLIRVSQWVISVMRGNPISDPVAVSFVWAAALWGVATWMVWIVRGRRQVLLGVAPAGILLVTPLFYLGSGTFGVLLLVLCIVLLMMALVGYDKRMRRLEAAGIDIAYGVASDVAIVSIALSLVLVTAAALLPLIPLEDIIDSIRDMTSRPTRVIVVVGDEGESIEDDVGSMEPLTTFDEMRMGGLPRQHLLTTPPDELNEQVVMVITTNELEPAEFAPDEVDVPNYYWRSVTYNRYDQIGWSTTGVQMVDYGVDEALGITPLESQRSLYQRVRFVNNLGGVIHVAGALRSVDADYTVAWRSREEDVFGAQAAVVSYRAESLLADPSAQELREAGVAYPDWIRQGGYLDVPDSVTPRTLALARDLTATEPTPYDRAKAIETYLRTTYSYTLDLPLPPRDQDVVDYFLFDLEQGYCEYYASAMVVMARAAGLPARYAIGYASGRYDPYGANFVVTEAYAHAWPEVYFPGYGWITFEPTAGRAAIDREAGAGSDRDLFPPDDGLGESGEEGLGWRWWLVLAGGLVIAVLVNVLWPYVDRWRLHYVRPATVIDSVYGRLQRHSRRLAVPSRPGSTPYEFVAAFATWLESLDLGPRWHRALSPAVDEVRSLVDIYVKMSYSVHRPDSIDRVMTLNVWQRLRWRLWLAWLFLRQK